ncbi:TOMM precursor leader peptide-binding protein [Xylophilus sp. GW821-FHT01B05]
MDRGLSADLYGGVFQWHGRYLPPLLGQGWLQLLGEAGAYLFTSPAVVTLGRVLQQGASLESYCRATGSASLLAEMLHALEGLLRQDFVRPAGMPDGDHYATPNFSVSFTRRPVSREVDAIVLSEVLSGDAAEGWACMALAAQAGHGRLTFVFCDDYLDPRLGLIDAQQKVLGQPWLLVRPAGEQAMVGPLFMPQSPDMACWHCLAHRLRRNQPARAWWQAQSNSPALALPVRCGDGLIQARLQAMLPLGQEVLAQGRQHILTLQPPGPGSAQRGQPQAHTVIARPQCPQCGSPGLLAERQQRSIVPASCLRTARRDGGSRSMPAAHTVERLSPHLSALCGVITEVTPLGCEGEDALRVYRSGIFKTPWSDSTAPPAAWSQLCLGKGMSPEQSRASAMCEAVERYAAFYQGDEASVTAPVHGLDGRCIPPQSLVFFSDRQYETGEARRPGPGGTPQVLAAPAPDEPLSWAPAWSLTQQARCYLPLGFCYAHAPAQSTRHAGWTSNGCAAGNTVEEAMLQGFLELVERDAAAIWWYNEIPRPAFDLDSLPAGVRMRVTRTLGPQWRYWVLDIRHDFGIPVAVAVGRHQTSGDWAIGFGCSLDAVVACERALTEICQLIAAGKQFSIADAHSAFLMGAQDAPATVPRAEEPAESVDIADEISTCVGIARKLGLETLVLDYSRPDIPLHCVKMVVPGLCHIWPERANPRLYHVPVTMGWRTEPLNERNLNPQGLYV